jgi:ubiquinone/menaquinone biosynthesis C-methylase UbiE
MKTSLSPENPFGYDRYGFAFENMVPGSRCLDYGCYDGKFMHAVTQRKAVEFVGVDVNSTTIPRNEFNQALHHIREAELPFESDSFDVVTILDVIEHVKDQDRVLQELRRVLKPGGTLIITAPKKHIFSFLDVGNFKFMFPSLHKAFFTWKHSPEEYRLRYIDNPDGMIGDVSKEKAWHEHFSEPEMRALLEKNGFEVEKFDGSALFMRVFIILGLLKLSFLLPPGSDTFDNRTFEHMNLFCRARKS